MGIVRNLLEAALILLLSSVTAVAHRSAAAYDVNSIIRIDGTVRSKSKQIA
jgi:hypothetical protein